MFYGRAAAYGEALDRGDRASLAAALARNVRPDDADCGRRLRPCRLCAGGPSRRWPRQPRPDIARRGPDRYFPRRRDRRTDERSAPPMRAETSSGEPGVVRSQCRAACRTRACRWSSRRTRRSAPRSPPTTACSRSSRWRAELLVEPGSATASRSPARSRPTSRSNAWSRWSRSTARSAKRCRPLLPGGFQARPSRLSCGRRSASRRRRSRQPGDLLRRHDRCRRAGRGVFRAGHRPLSAQAKAPRWPPRAQADDAEIRGPLYEKLNSLRRKALKTPSARSASASIAVVWRPKTAIFAPLPPTRLVREKVRQFPRDTDLHRRHGRRSRAEGGAAGAAAR